MLLSIEDIMTKIHIAGLVTLVGCRLDVGSSNLLLNDCEYSIWKLHWNIATLNLICTENYQQTGQGSHAPLLGTDNLRLNYNRKHCLLGGGGL